MHWRAYTPPFPHAACANARRVSSGKGFAPPGLMVSKPTRSAVVACGFAALVLLAGYVSRAAADGDAPAAPPALPAMAEPGRGGDAPSCEAAEKRIHNFFRLSEHVFSGASPESDSDF